MERVGELQVNKTQGKSSSWGALGLHATAVGLWLFVLAALVVGPALPNIVMINLYLEWSILPAALQVLIGVGFAIRRPEARIEFLRAVAMGLLYCLGWLFMAFVAFPAWESLL